ncbi:MAG TPA: amidase [Chloroflexota bacterium]|nr:amidase [Chloroflexota bacterium]
MIESRDVSPVEVTRALFDRIDRLEPRLRSFIRLEPEQALTQALAAEVEIARGGYRGPLHGIPLGIKDNIAVAGWPTTSGSALMSEFVTDYDATVVQRLRAAGATIVGKNNMHEWAMGGSCSNGPFGTVHNPWDETRVPGGSSGGSAAAVSASLIYGSLGTDGMGSIRTPASYCGVVGFKPTYGLVSRFGQLPPTSSTSDHVGPITKDVRDAAILLGAIAGYDANDPTSIQSASVDYHAEVGRPLSGLRVGVPVSYFFENAEPEIQALVHEGVRQLASIGGEVHEIHIPWVEKIGLVSAAQGNESNAFLLQYARLGPQAFADRTIWERVIAGQFVRRADAAQAGRLRSLIRREFANVLQEVDVIVTPTNPTPAFLIDVTGDLPGGKPGGNLAITNALTSPFNFTGMPAVSVPCGFTADGLPVGMTISGRHWEDALVLRAAHQYQVATGGYRSPPIT